MRNQRLLCGILIGGLLWASGCSDNCSSWWSCPVGDTVDLADLGASEMGVPPGDAPYIKWSPNRLPIGTPSTVVLAGRAMGVTLEQSGSSSPVSVKSTTTNPDGTTWLTIEPTWGTLTPGPANLVLTNSFGSIKSAVTLVKPAFSSPKSTPVPGTAQWISIAQFNGQPSLFGQDSATVWSVPYMNGTFGSLKLHSTGLALSTLAPVMNFTNLGATTFFSVSAASTQDIYRYWVQSVGKNYVFSALKFGTPVPVSATATALAVGEHGPQKLLLSIADNQKNHYSCLYSITSLSPSVDQGGPCNKQSPLPASATSLFVKPLDSSGFAQVIALLDSGGLSVWASDGNGTLTDRTAAAGVANHKDLLALAVADMDGDKDVDLVGVTASSIVVFLNDGKGVFKEVRTAISNVVVQNLTLGDIDKDGYPDVLLTVKPAGEVLTLLNVADGGEGTGRLTGPVGTGVKPGAGCVLTLDGQDSKEVARRLIWHDPTSSTLYAADNATLP